MKTVFLFPGQGAQYPGMAEDLWEASPAVRELFALASEVAGYRVDDLVFRGTEEDLRATDKTQLAVTVTNLAAAVVLKEAGVRPTGVAGFSLGEFAAVVEAAILPTEVVLRLVKLRGAVMEAASRELDSADGNPGMAAVMGLDYPVVAKTIADAGIEGLFTANYNSPAQTVISGTHTALVAAEAPLKAAGAKRVIRLKVSGPFHCPLLQPAQTAFAAELDELNFADPAIAFYSNVSGRRVESGIEARSLLARQITSPVVWVDVERAILADGVDRVAEVGPGNVLGGLWKALGTDIVCATAGTVDGIQSFAAGGGNAG